MLDINWLLAHPGFHKNQLYVAGDSYSGILVPIIVQKISDGNEAGVKPAMNLQGYVLVNPTTTPHDDYNYRIPFAYMKALISQKQFESIKTNCKGEYINVDPNNTLCVNDLHSDRYDVFSTLEYHRNLIKKGYRILIYSGDHDMVIPHISTYAWIESLNLTIATDWEPWFVDGQIAGYTMESNYKKSRLTYATVKGAGHTAPEYKPKECFAMVNSHSHLKLSDQNSLKLTLSLPPTRLILNIAATDQPQIHAAIRLRPTPPVCYGVVE
ncbi:hypothetical protein ACJW31_07G086800 [Castanea mollissima]